MKYRWDKKYLHWGVTIFLVVLAGMACFGAFFQFPALLGTVKWILGVFTPVWYGLVIAFLLNPLMKFFEKLYIRIFQKQFRKAKHPARFRSICRAVCVLLAVLVMLAIIAGLLWMVIPQLISSVEGIFGNFESYYANLQHWLNGTLKNNQDFAGVIGVAIEKGFEAAKTWINNNVISQIDNIISGVTSGILSFFVVLKDLIIGFIIAIYLLFSKEKFIGQLKKTTYALMKKERANALIRTGQDANHYFGGFIIGKILDSAIIGALCFILMSIFQMPFAPLVSAIIGVTNIIPFFGPFIGAIPSGILILMVDPMQCLYFIILIIVLQQFDGNILGPKILGDSTGLSGFWVIFAIVVFGGLFGVFGIVIGVPVFALIYSWFTRRITQSLKKRKMALDTHTYMESGCIYEDDPEIDVDGEHYSTPVKVDPAKREAENQRHAKKKVSGWINRLREKRKKELEDGNSDGDNKS